MNQITQKKCDICYEIKCARCNWIANQEDVNKIQKGLLSSCPICGWIPNKSSNIQDAL